MEGMVGVRCVYVVLCVIEEVCGMVMDVVLGFDGVECVYVVVGFIVCVFFCIWISVWCNRLCLIDEIWSVVI